MTEAENVKLPDNQLGEVEEMAEIRCTNCGDVCEVAINPNVVRSIVRGAGGREVAPVLDVIRGVRTCRYCEAQTIFELKGNVPSFIPGPLFSEDLRDDVAPNAKVMFNEALMCLYGGSLRGAVTMCRSSVEEALVAKNVEGRDLHAKIENAPESILGPEERSQAIAAKLTGRDAVHYMADIGITEALLALGATVNLVNHVAQQSALPASQS